MLLSYIWALMDGLEFKAVHYRLHFKSSFGIAHGTRDFTDAVFIRAGFNGHFGYGEAAVPPYLSWDVPSIVADFHNWFPAHITGSGAIRDVLIKISKDHNDIPLPLKAAVDIALHDLLGKITGRPVRQLFEVPERKVPCCYTLGFGPIEEMKGKIAAANDFGLFKIKLGATNDHERVEAAIEAGVKNFCVDANQAWKSVDVALYEMNRLRELGCIFVEQPLPVSLSHEYESLYRASCLPVILDESVQNKRDLDALSKVCHGINVKLMKCGGLGPGADLIKTAGRMGLKILLGCMSEGSCGAMAAAQLSGFADWVDLDGPALIDNDPFGVVRYNDGILCLLDTPGTGAELIKIDLFS